MTLSEISAALQRGEALTHEQKSRTMCRLKGWTLTEWYDDLGAKAGGFDYYKGDEDSRGYFFANHGDPFTSVDAALAFVAEVFPDFVYTSGNMRDGVRVNWFRLSWASSPYLSGFDIHGDAKAPTPSAAIMAAAIEAHLAKGDTE